MKNLLTNNEWKSISNLLEGGQHELVCEILNGYDMPFKIKTDCMWLGTTGILLKIISLKYIFYLIDRNEIELSNITQIKWDDYIWYDYV